jgi:hypothetical protein
VQRADDLWFGGPRNELDSSLFNREGSERDYSSRLIRWWSLFREARVEIVTAGVVNKSLLFDVRGTTNENWFSPTRLGTGPGAVVGWTDVPRTAGWEGSSTGRYFSIRGHGARSFYINNNWGGCSTDQGWMVLPNTTAGCPNTIDIPGTVRYSALTTMNRTDRFVVADALMIFGR